MHWTSAETIPGPATLELAELTSMYGVYVVLGMPEKDAENAGIYYNSAAVLGPEGVIGSYRKIHPAGKESIWAAKGKDPLMFDTPWGPVGVGICHDTYCFPELTRYYSALGSRLYLNPTAVSNVQGWKDLYYTQLKARSIENGAYVVSSNLVGKDDTSFFPGGSLILGPCLTLGTEYYAEPIEDKEGMVIATIDLSIADSARKLLTLFNNNSITGKPDWRPDIYTRMLDSLKDTETWKQEKELAGSVVK
ncbi:MAG: 5-aminopentanamidase [Bacilli bacterium]|nr:5-aminopentanamidase [Bacilli bacterium]